MVTLEMVCCLVVNIEMLAFLMLLVVLFEIVLSLIDYHFIMVILAC